MPGDPSTARQPDPAAPAALPGRIPAAVPRAAPPVALIDTALQLTGIRYRWGGSDLNGFDCSGFTQYVFAQHGLALPREVRDQYREGRSVRSRDIQAGDLLFFSTTEPGASHVAIALGGEEFVHAPSSNGVVRIESLETEYWSDRFVGARRVE